MSELERLRVENARLRQEIEEWRSRQEDDLRKQLAEAIAAAEHYRAEAVRNADLGQRIYREAQAEIIRLRERVALLERTRDVRDQGRSRVSVGSP